MLEEQTLSRLSCLPNLLFLLRIGVLLCALVGCPRLTDLGGGLHINQAELSTQIPPLD